MAEAIFILSLLLLVVSVPCKGGISILNGPSNATVAAGDPVTFRCKFSGTLDLPQWNIGKTIYSSSYLPAGFHYSVVREGLYIPTVWESLNNTMITCLFVVYNGSGNLSRIESSPAYLIVFGGSQNGRNSSDDQVSTPTNNDLSAAPPSQPARLCFYYNGTHVVLCAQLQFNITGLTIATSTCDGMYYSVTTTHLCEPIPISNIANMTHSQSTNFSITAHNDAGASPPTAIDIKEPKSDFCQCIAAAENMPQGAAHYIQQNRVSDSVEFGVLQPTSSLTKALRINLCSGVLGVTIRAANGRSSTFQQMWNMNMCDPENGQANVSLNLDDFPDSAAANANYTVVFNISLRVDGVADFCYLQLEVDNVTIFPGSEPQTIAIIGIGLGLLAVLVLFSVLLCIKFRHQKTQGYCKTQSDRRSATVLTEIRKYHG